MIKGAFPIRWNMLLMIGQFAICQSTWERKQIMKHFLKRGYYWRNVIDPETGYARMKDSKGEWLPILIRINRVRIIIMLKEMPGN